MALSSSPPVAAGLDGLGQCIELGAVAEDVEVGALIVAGGAGLNAHRPSRGRRALDHGLDALAAVKLGEDARAGGAVELLLAAGDQDVAVERSTMTR